MRKWILFLKFKYAKYRIRKRYKQLIKEHGIEKANEMVIEAVVKTVIAEKINKAIREIFKEKTGVNE